MACGSSTGGFSAILYVVDAADRDSVPISRSELHELLTKPSLSGIPLHVLSNKIDKSEANSKQALMDQIGLELIRERERERSILLHDLVQRLWKHRRLSLTGL